MTNVTLIAAVGTQRRHRCRPRHAVADSRGLRLLQADHDGPRHGHGPRPSTPSAACCPAANHRRDPPAGLAPRRGRDGALPQRGTVVAGPADEVFVCGGGQIYAEAMPWAPACSSRRSTSRPNGDVHFPTIDPAPTPREVARDDQDGFSWVTCPATRLTVRAGVPVAASAGAHDLRPACLPPRLGSVLTAMLTPVRREHGCARPRRRPSRLLATWSKPASTASSRRHDRRVAHLDPKTRARW